MDAAAAPDLPDTIEVPLTAVDLRKAGAYSHGDSCLMATALKRLGFSDPWVGADDVRISGVPYMPDTVAGIAITPSAMLLPERKDEPFTKAYRPELVGKVVVLRKQKTE